MRLAAHGIKVELPRGWEGRIYRRPGGDPTLHAGNFALPHDDGDFGSGATGRMPPHGAFLVLKEYRPGPRLVPGTGLFASHSIPLPLDLSRFHPRALQVGRPEQAGMQHFFSSGGRAFCLYAVVKRARGVGAARAHEQVGRLSHILSSLSIEAHR
jgi:hypothetical protein